MSTEENDAPITGGVSASPSWMATQAPKTEPTKAAESTPPKSRRPRRTKAQMLADAAARPDAQRTVIAPSLLVDMAREDTASAVARDLRVDPENGGDPFFPRGFFPAKPIRHWPVSHDTAQWIAIAFAVAIATISFWR